MSNLPPVIVPASLKNRRALIARTISCIAWILSAFLAATSANAAPILWNQLGSNAEVLNSAYGPDLAFYGGGSWPDVTGAAGYTPGVFGNALTVGAGAYGSQDRVHTVVWNDLNQHLNPDRGTISVWFRQTQNPVAFQHGIYRVFDGAYGLGSGMGLWSDVNAGNPTLFFGLEFGGTYSGVTHNISALNGSWVHLAGVWDRDGIGGSGDAVRFYVNGVVAETNSLATWGSTVGQRAGIGGGNDDQIAGKFAVDNLKVFDTALTDFSDRFAESSIPEPSAAVAASLSLAVVALGRRFRKG